MSALQRSVARIRDSTWNEAIGACLAIDSFKRQPSGSFFQEIQEATLRGLASVEERARQLRQRQKIRRSRTGKRLKRSSGLSGIVGQHNLLLSNRDELLSEQREMFRQVGDALAWVLLQGNQRRLRLLFVEGRTHRLPQGVGLAAAIEVTRQLNRSGEVLALMTDITRCVGVGDVIVVQKNNPIPLALELKASSLTSGGAEVGFYSPTAEGGPVRALFDLVSDILGLQDSDPDSHHDARTERQVTELIERTDFAAIMSSRLATELQNPKSDHWPNISGLLKSAYVAGSAYDTLEPGVIAIAVRLQPTDYPRAALMTASRKAKEVSGFGERARVVTTTDLLGDDTLSPFIPPIPLWPLPGDLRNALMGGKLYLAIAVQPGVWDAAFAAAGIHRTSHEGGWVVRKGNQEATFDPIEVSKLTLGVGIAGMSPRAIADVVGAAFDRESS